MNCIASLTIYCLEVSQPQCIYLVQVRQVIESQGLRPIIGPTSTSFEGPLDIVLATMKKRIKLLHHQGVPKVKVQLNISSRRDNPISINDRVQKMSTSRQ